jgi:hypothetical protein
MQRLRFQRFAALWKIALEETLPELDIWQVLFQTGVSKLVSPQVRRDLVYHCSKPEDQLRNYLVILEANDNPYAVQDRFEKEVIDRAFD